MKSGEQLGKHHLHTFHFTHLSSRILKSHKSAPINVLHSWLMRLKSTASWGTSILSRLRGINYLNTVSYMHTYMYVYVCMELHLMKPHLSNHDKYVCVASWDYNLCPHSPAPKATYTRLWGVLHSTQYCVCNSYNTICVTEGSIHACASYTCSQEPISAYGLLACLIPHDL